MRLMLEDDKGGIHEVCDLDEDGIMPESYDIARIGGDLKYRLSVMKRMNTDELADCLLRTMRGANPVIEPLNGIFHPDNHVYDDLPAIGATAADIRAANDAFISGEISASPSMEDYVVFALSELGIKNRETPDGASMSNGVARIVNNQLVHPVSAETIAKGIVRTINFVRGHHA